MGIRYLFGSVKLNDGEKEYIERKILKVEKLLRKEKPEEVKINIEVGQDRRLFWKISVNLSTPKKSFRVSKKDSDLFKAVDVTEEALLKQIRRENERVRDTIRARKRER